LYPDLLPPILLLMLTVIKGALMKQENELTPVEAARRLGIGLDYLYALLWTGKLKARKIAGRWRIPVAEVEARLRRRGEQ
jgi:excisionase family DNA binding protein